MADKYCYSGAAGAGTGADWANAYTTFALAIAGLAAGDTLYVANDHAESTAAGVTLTFPGTSASPNRVLCVNRAGSVPPGAADLTTGASVTTTGASQILMRGHFHCHGVTFNAGTGAGSAANLILASLGATQYYHSCAINLVNTTAGSRIDIGAGNNGGRAELYDTTVSFGSTSQGFSSNLGALLWKNKPGSSAVTGATIPTTLIPSISLTGSMELDGLDLSALGAGNTIVGDIANSSTVRLVNCKLGASVTVAATPSTGGRGGTDAIGCSSASSVRRDEKYRYRGTLTTETTIVRTGGASDGTTAYSWKVVTTANAKREAPFETFEGALLYPQLASDQLSVAKTLTIHIVTDNVTLTDAECWLEVEYLASSATPVTTLATDSNATVLTTAANQASSTEAWTTTGLGTPVYQKLEVTFTPEMAGPIRWRVKVAKASTTVYICPEPELS